MFAKNSKCATLAVVLIAGLAMATSASANTLTLPADTAAYYSFSSAATLGVDGSGTDNTLIATGAQNGQYVHYDANGRPGAGGALYTDNYDYMSTVGNFVGEPVGNSPYTVAAWFKIDDGCAGNGGVVAYGYSGFDSPTSRSNNYRLDGFNAIRNYAFFNDLPATLPSGDLLGAWHSVIGTWDGATRSVYIDGQLIASDGANGGLAIEAGPLVIGRTLYDAAWKGWIDDVLVTRSAFTPTQIADYQNGVAVPEPGTIMLLATGLVGLLAYAWQKRR